MFDTNYDDKLRIDGVIIINGYYQIRADTFIVDFENGFLKTVININLQSSICTLIHLEGKVFSVLHLHIYAVSF